MANFFQRLLEGSLATSRRTFATIITMLSYIKRARDFIHTDPSLTTMQRQWLDALNALATILGMNHKILAVTENLNSESKDPQVCLHVAQLGKDLTRLCSSPKHQIDGGDI